MSEGIDVVPAERWAELAPLLFAANGFGRDVVCLHSDAGASEREYAEELAALDPGEAMFVARRSGADWVAVAGAEVVPSQGRAWLRGPLARVGVDAGAARELLMALVRQLPQSIDQLDAFVAAGSSLVEIYTAAGFAPVKTHQVFLAPARIAAAAVLPGLAVAAVQPAWRDLLAVLHASEFPNSYLDAATLLGPQTSGRTTLVALLDQAPVGYVHIHFDAASREVYIDYLAVAPHARGRGVGRALLQSAVCWSVENHRVTAVRLTVAGDNLNAQGLYRSAGFERVRSGINLRLVRSSATST